MKLRMYMLTLTSLAAAQSASAQDRATPFSGPSVTIISGYDEHPYDTSGVLYGGAIGYDLAAGKGRLGVEAEATGSTADSCTQLIPTTQACVKRGRDLYVGGRAGVVAGPVLLYGKVGYTNAKQHVDIRGTLPAGYPGATYSYNNDGYRVGGGVETSIDHFLVRAEYRHSDYGRAGVGNQFVAGVGVRF